MTMVSPAVETARIGEKLTADDVVLFSVVICTYKRASLVAKALASLCALTFDPSRIEVIVVDNNSQDNTRYVVEEFCRNHANVRYCLEREQGLSHARNRGWQEATGVYVAYIDDECIVPAQWLTVAAVIVNELAPAVFGGPFLGYYDTPVPRWWKEVYGALDYSCTARPLRADEHISGGNLIVQRQLLAEMAGFNTTLGMTGQTVAFGEETELQQRIRAARPDALIYYDPKLYLYHLVRPEKLSIRWVLRSRFAGGRNSHQIYQGNRPSFVALSRAKLLFRAAQTTMHMAGDLLINGVRRNREQFPYLQNYLYEETAEYVHRLGIIYEQYGHSRRRDTH